ncbi:hypothetical protein O0L34_g6474 [Tuta absoluta]|nr:hypothetical protein O0L34_g6474 [Tuta absoluta]
MLQKKFVVVSVFVVCYVHASYGAIEGSQPNAITEDIKNETAKGERAGKSLHKECSGSFSTKCMKLHVLSYLEDLNARDEVSLPLPGLSIVKENTSNARSPEELAAELARKFPGKPEEKLNGYILQRLQDFMDGHSLKYKLLDAKATKRALDIAQDFGGIVTGRGGGGGGGGGFGGGKGGGAGLLAAALAGKGALAAAALGALALLAGKALAAALAAMLLAALAGMKGGGGGHKTTYEIITQPHESHSHSNSHEEHHEHEHHGHGHYRRAYEMPYNSYMPYDSSASADRTNINNTIEISSEEDGKVVSEEENPTKAFDGVYSECFMHLSYSCIQGKTLVYLKELNKLSEVSIIGDYVKFVKINETTQKQVYQGETEVLADQNSEELSLSIDQAVDDFFNNHVLKFKALGRDVSVPNSVEEFVGRKRKGGGGGGGGGGGHGHEDGGKKKMMMMAMMCMKMKLMMMVPAMMGMMGMMSFKGMMFSMMSFMVSKGWAAGGGGGGGAWMPAGGQDYGGGGGGGGGYDANGQWQSRSMVDVTGELNTTPIREYHFVPMKEREPIISYPTPHVRYDHAVTEKKPYTIVKKLNDEVIKVIQGAVKSRKKRGILDLLQSSYLYLTNQLLGIRRNTRVYPKYPNYRIINGIRYVYFPLNQIKKAPRELKPQPIAPITEVTEETPIITAEYFNKGEILQGEVENRSIKMKKIKKMANDANEVVEEDPWE